MAKQMTYGLGQVQRCKVYLINITSFIQLPNIVMCADPDSNSTKFFNGIFINGKDLDVKYGFHGEDKWIRNIKTDKMYQISSEKVSESIQLIQATRGVWVCDLTKFIKLLRTFFWTFNKY